MDVVLHLGLRSSHVRTCALACASSTGCGGRCFHVVMWALPEPGPMMQIRKRLEWSVLPVMQLLDLYSYAEASSGMCGNVVTRAMRSL